MGRLRQSIPDALSLSRIFASVLFLLTFSTTHEMWFWVAMTTILYAAISDSLDGFLARRWGLVSERGYYLDGLGDKSFTVAVCLVVAREFPEASVLMWAIIFRDITLYAVRVIDPHSAQNSKRYRRLSLTNAGFLRVSFVLFFVQTYFLLTRGGGLFDDWVWITMFTLTSIVGFSHVALLVRRVFSAPA